MKHRASIPILLTLLSILAIVVALPTVSFSEVPHQISYQGRLTDAEGNPVGGAYVMSFSIYDVSAGGTALWWESQTVTIDGGIYNVQIGQDPTGNPFPVNLFDGLRWLGVVVGTDDEMIPRQPLTSTPFAFKAANADTLDGFDSSAFGDITGINAGTGLTGGGTSGDVQLDADTNYLQARVSGSCGVENSIRAVNPDGSVLCEPDDTGITVETDPTVLSSVKDGIVWTEIGDRPPGLDDGDDIGLSGETDPQVGSNTLNYIPRWDGSALISGSIFDNGNVGIGTINPDKILTLQGDYSFGEIRLQQNYWDTLLYWDIGSPDPGPSPLYFSYNDSTKITFTTNGSIGIGTNIPQNKLDVEGGVAVGPNYSGWETGPPDGMIIEGNVGIGTPVATEKLVVKVGGTHWTDPHFSLEAYGTTDTWDFTIGGESRFFIGYNESSKIVVDVDGKVGIGATEPSEKLDVVGNIETTGDYKYASSRTYYKNLPPHAFSLQSNDGTDADYFINDFNGSLEITGSPLQHVHLVTDLDLPQGATVTKFAAHYYDNHPVEGGIIIITSLLRYRILSYQRHAMAHIDEVSAGASEERRSFSDTAIDYATIDNQNYWYGIDLIIRASMVSSLLNFYGIQIEYTMDIVAP